MKEICLHGHDMANEDRPIQIETDDICAFLQHFPLADTLVFHSPSSMLSLNQNIPQPVNQIQTVSFEGKLDSEMAEATLPMFPQLLTLRFELYRPSYLSLSSDLQEHWIESTVPKEEVVWTILEDLLLRKGDSSPGFARCPLLENLEISGLHFSNEETVKLQKLMRTRTEMLREMTRDASKLDFCLTLRNCVLRTESSGLAIPHVRSLTFLQVEQLLKKLLAV